MKYEIKIELQNIILGNESFSKGSSIQSITDHIRRSKKQVEMLNVQYKK